MLVGEDPPVGTSRDNNFEVTVAVALPPASADLAEFALEAFDFTGFGAPAAVAELPAIPAALDPTSPADRLISAFAAVDFEDGALPLAPCPPVPSSTGFLRFPLQYIRTYRYIAQVRIVTINELILFDSSDPSK